MRLTIIEQSSSSGIRYKPITIIRIITIIQYVFNGWSEFKHN